MKRLIRLGCMSLRCLPAIDLRNPVVSFEFAVVSFEGFHERHVRAFSDDSFDLPVRGFIHRPGRECAGDGLMLTHGAGSNANTSLLIALAEAFADAGFTVLRYDLPFRQTRRSVLPGRGTLGAIVRG